MNEQHERYEALALAIKECVELGASDETLETLCFESGFSTMHLEQTKREVDNDVEDFFQAALAVATDARVRAVVSRAMRTAN